MVEVLHAPHPELGGLLLGLGEHLPRQPKPVNACSRTSTDTRYILSEHGRLAFSCTALSISSLFASETPERDRNFQGKKNEETPCSLTQQIAPRHVDDLGSQVQIWSSVYMALT